MKTLVCIATLAMAGCSTVSDLRQTPPIVDSSSQRSVQEISGCIAEHWQRRSSTLTAAPRPNGTSLTLSSQVMSKAYPVIVVDIDDQGTARSVKAYIKGNTSSDTANDDPGNREITSCL
jgi:hypothetical protein